MLSRGTQACGERPRKAACAGRVGHSARRRGERAGPAQQAVCRKCHARSRLVRSRLAVGAGGGPSKRELASGAGGTCADGANPKRPGWTGRAVTGTRKRKRPAGAELANRGAWSVGWKRVHAGSTGVTCSIPTQAGRERPQRAELAVHVGRGGAGPAAGEQVVLARGTEDAGSSGWAPSTRHTRTVEPIPGQSRRKRALAALGLHAAVAERGALARHARRVVHAVPA